MCHPAWGPACAPAPYPRELVRVRRLKDLVDRGLLNGGTFHQDAHDAGWPLAADVAALVSHEGVTTERLAAEFALAYGTSVPDYIASRRLITAERRVITAGRRAVPSHR